MKQRTKQRAAIHGWHIFGISAIAVLALGALSLSISERRKEASVARLQFMLEIAEFEADNAKWGASFPREFASWESTRKMENNTKYGGSKMRDYLMEDPRLVVMWAGYPFAKEYNQARGHYWALEDVKGTDRRSPKTPGTCYSCKSPDVPRLMNRDGVDKFYSAKFDQYLDDVKNPIGCADCHNNKTMALQISRPGLKEAYAAMGKDISNASQQEMRSLVCAQCHVEYYFKGKKEQYLTFPWKKGLTVESFEEYYAENGHSDWTHAISGAKMIKMQHPDFELYQQGVHSFRNVSCADCHMPYKSEGGVKYTDHQIRSPLLNISNSCQVCHRWSEDEVKSRVTSIQDKTRSMLDQAEDAIVALHFEIGDAMKLGATDAELEEARSLVSKSQMYWDYVAASNGMGFHAPQESARILGKSLNYAADGRIAILRILAKFGQIEAKEYPKLKSKDEAKAVIKPYVEAQQKAQAAKEAASAKP